MATTAVLGYSTLMDVVNSYTSLDTQAQYLWAAEVLNRKCPLTRILPMMESNQIMSNIDSRRSYIPAPGTRRFNVGVAPTASHKTPFTDPIAMVEDYSEVDYALWKIQNNPNQWRQDEDAAHMEGLTEKIEDLLWYASLATDPAAINGLATRFNSLTKRPNNDSGYPYNVISNGGASSGSMTSLWLIEFGKNKVFGIYPKNMPGGLLIEDLGRETSNTGTGTSPTYMEVLRSHFAWYMGITVKDERCVQRIANILPTGTTNILDEDVLIKAINQLPGGGEAPGTAIFCTRNIKTQFDVRAKDKTNVYYTPDEVWGGRITRFQGVPIFMAERLLETETTVA